MAPKKFQIALANLRHPESPEQSVELVLQAIAKASVAGASLICFPECFVPGYRGLGKQVPPPDAEFLERARARIAAAAGEANVAVVLGTERIVDGALRATALVIARDGTIAGFQDKVQVDPSEDDIYAPGSERHVFESDGVKFGIAICHEGWRYPETVRWAVKRGAQIVFHPHLHERDAGGHVPSSFAEVENTFHEKALLCRAAENTCYVASVNCASEGSATTSAVVGPDGTVIAFQPYGEEGLLLVEVDLALATGLLAKRLKPLS